MKLEGRLLLLSDVSPLEAATAPTLLPLLVLAEMARTERLPAGGGGLRCCPLRLLGDNDKLRRIVWDELRWLTCSCDGLCFTCSRRCFGGGGLRCCPLRFEGDSDKLCPRSRRFVWDEERCFTGSCDKLCCTCSSRCCVFRTWTRLRGDSVKLSRRRLFTLGLLDLIFSLELSTTF
jgi:hypothetical protein